MIKDRVAAHNERVKLLAGFFNALGLALIGVGALAPAISFLGQSGAVPPVATLNVKLVASSALLGLISHAFAHYILGELRRAAPDDPA